MLEARSSEDAAFRNEEFHTGKILGEILVRRSRLKAELRFREEKTARLIGVRSAI
jgi:hypothetical protein